MSVPVFDAEVAVKSQNALGEGILWDERTQLLHWVDIDRAEIHSYDVESTNYAVESFPESEFVTALSPRKDRDGFIAAIESKIVLVSPAKPTAPAPETGAVRAQSTATVAEPLDAAVAAQHLVRFNDGASDAAGRFVIGSMRRPEIRDGKNWGQLFSITPGGEVTTLLEDVGTSNGIDWSLDNKLMYYVDSGHGRIDVFDYDLATGAISNRRPFVDGHPEPLDGPTGGGVAFDGLVVDGVGNVWVARWGESRVIGYAPDGTMIAQIRTVGARSPTIPCFGGKDLSTMYIASASAGLAGASQDEWPESGNVLKIECGPGSELSKVLGEGWKGRVRHRFGG